MTNIWTPDISEETNQISACDKALLLDYKAQLLFPRKEYDSALEVIDFCESTVTEIMGTNNLDYGMCEFYRGVIAYTRSQPVIAEQHLLNADAVFHSIMNEKPDNDYTKSTARFLYSLYSYSLFVFSFSDNFFHRIFSIKDISNQCCGEFRNRKSQPDKTHTHERKCPCKGNE